MQSELSSTGRYSTENAKKYMQQLCKHFAHKIEISVSDTSAKAAFPMGPCHMNATTSELLIDVTAPDAEGLEKAKHIVDKHLERFAFREGFTTMKWD